MIALSVPCRQHVIAQAEKISHPLPAELKRVQSFFCAWREKIQRFPLRLGFEELPNRAHLHELRRLALHFFHAFE